MERNAAQEGYRGAAPPMGTDTAEMKLARVLPVSSINVRGSIRFRQPGRPSDLATCAANAAGWARWRSPSCLPSAHSRPPTASARPANRRTVSWPLRAEGTAKSRQAESARIKTQSAMDMV
jgi:hypothetical protein